MDVDTEDRECENKGCKDQRDPGGGRAWFGDKSDKKQPRWLRCLRVLFIV